MYTAFREAAKKSSSLNGRAICVCQKAEMYTAFREAAKKVLLLMAGPFVYVKKQKCILPLGKPQKKRSSLNGRAIKALPPSLAP